MWQVVAFYNISATAPSLGVVSDMVTCYSFAEAAIEVLKQGRFLTINALVPCYAEMACYTRATVTGFGQKVLTNFLHK